MTLICGEIHRYKHIISVIQYISIQTTANKCREKSVCKWQREGIQWVEGAGSKTDTEL